MPLSASNRSAPVSRRAGRLACTLLLPLLPGCAALSYLGTTNRGHEHGKIWFVGGAGSVGNVVGTFDVPRGLRAAGWKGAIETFGWQSALGGTLRDQMDRERNEREARRLAERIDVYMNSHPGRPVSVIAMSAGTGIATWGLEALPAYRRVDNVAFLSSSLSRSYDLTEALRHVRGKLHVFHSEADPVLKFMMPVAGSVDRELFTDAAVGLYGVALPAGASPQTRALYQAKVRNHAYRGSYAKYLYFGFHADSIAAPFIERVVGPLVLAPPPRDLAAANGDDGVENGVAPAAHETRAPAER